MADIGSSAWLNVQVHVETEDLPDPSVVASAIQRAMRDVRTFMGEPFRVVGSYVDGEGYVDIDAPTPADLRLALEMACRDGWADVEGAMRYYVGAAIAERS